MRHESLQRLERPRSNLHMEVEGGGCHAGGGQGGGGKSTIL